MTNEQQQLRKQAYHRTNALLQLGLLQRPATCSCCGRRSQIHAHHEDYTKPEEITWLCYRCHGLRHVELGTVSSYGASMAERRALWNKGQCRLKGLIWK